MIGIMANKPTSTTRGKSKVNGPWNPKKRRKKNPIGLVTASRPIGVARREAIRARAQRTKWARTFAKTMPKLMRK